MFRSSLVLSVFFVLLLSSCAKFGSIDSLEGEWYGMHIDEMMEIRGEPHGVRNLRNGEKTIQYTIYKNAGDEEDALLARDVVPSYKQVLDPNYRKDRLYERLSPGGDYKTSCAQIFFINRQGIIYHWTQHGWICEDPD